MFVGAQEGSLTCILCKIERISSASVVPASRVITNLTQPLNQPRKTSKMYMVPVLSSSGMVPMTPVPNPTSTSQKIVLYPVKSTTGVQYYRRPDGQLYRLLPMSQLRQFKLKQAGQTGEMGCASLSGDHV